jgi:hypothetical protein
VAPFVDILPKKQEVNMFSLTLLTLIAGLVQPQWHTDYGEAWRRAVAEKKDLVIYFRKDNRIDDVLENKDLKKSLRRFVCLKVPTTYEYKGQRLLDYDALEDMAGKPGLVVVSLRDPKLPTHNQVISAHPFLASRYSWVPDYGPREIEHILDLPARATLSQRSMIYAIWVHPERPRSIFGVAHSAFLGHAARHSTRQASMRNQHHADLIGTLGRLEGEMGKGLGNGSEVVAESWGAFVGGETVLEASFSCIDAWRHSSGHWSAVSNEHTYFGYDIARSSSGTWYATGIFAD